MTAYKKKYLNIKKAEYIYIMFYKDINAAGKIVYQCLNPYEIAAAIEKLKSENSSGEYIHIYGNDFLN